MGLRIGMCGLGHFGRRFIHLFKAHPYVDEVVLADLKSNRVSQMSKQHEIGRTCSSFDELCKTNVDCIGIFTQRHLHGSMAVQALKTGKHVYSAVPAAITLEELDELVKTVEETRLMYMVGETSYYRPQTIYCRDRFAKGDFGRFVYGEGHYYHDMARFYMHYQHTGGENWKSVASFPPMLYPTHSICHILGVTFSKMTEVCCMGFTDSTPDGVFEKDVSMWNNVFSNETGLFRTADGGMARINEFRRTSAGESRQSIYGTLGTYEEQTGSAIWTSVDKNEWRLKLAEAESGVEKVDFKADEGIHREDMTSLRATPGIVITEERLGNLPKEFLGKKHLDVAEIQSVERLPAEFVGLETGHEGTHQFLVVDFLEAVVTGKLPPNHVWMAARCNAPGIVAHQSAMKDGELLKIPDYGTPPEDAELLIPGTELK